jgi:hypothetical protein
MSKEVSIKTQRDDEFYEELLKRPGVTDIEVLLFDELVNKSENEALSGMQVTFADCLIKKLGKQNEWGLLFGRLIRKSEKDNLKEKFLEDRKRFSELWGKVLTKSEGWEAFKIIKRWEEVLKEVFFPKQDCDFGMRVYRISRNEFPAFGVWDNVIGIETLLSLDSQCRVDKYIIGYEDSKIYFCDKEEDFE